MTEKNKTKQKKGSLTEQLTLTRVGRSIQLLLFLNLGRVLLAKCSHVNGAVDFTLSVLRVTFCYIDGFVKPLTQRGASRPSELHRTCRCTFWLESFGPAFTLSGKRTNKKSPPIIFNLVHQHSRSRSETLEGRRNSGRRQAPPSLCSAPSTPSRLLLCFSFPAVSPRSRRGRWPPFPFFCRLEAIRSSRGER